MIVKRDRASKSEINITNLVDVTFVLLIVFMITAPMMTQAIKVETPKVESESVEIKEDIKITIDKNKYIYLEDKVIEKEKLYSYLTEKLTPRELPILLNADEELPYGFVIEIVGEIRNIGYTKVGFITKSKKKNI